MLNSFLVMKKPIGVSSLLSKLGHHAFRSSMVLSSPVVLKRGVGTGTSAFSHSLRFYSSTVLTGSIKSTSTFTIKLTDSLSSSDDDEDEDEEQECSSDVIEDSDSDDDQLDGEEYC